MDSLLAGLFGWTLGSSLASRPQVCHHDNTTLENLQRESNRLKTKEIELKDDEIYLNKVKQFVDSVDVNCNRDDLEISVYDELEESKYITMFYNECEKQNKITPFGGRWSQEKYVGFYNFLKAKTVKTIDEEMMIKACEKFIFQSCKHFGKYIGRSTDRYDYFMYLKNGPSYQAKYIPQDELLKILGSNKYGYSKHLMNV